MKWEAELRAEWVRKLVDESGASGVVLGFSGGKDSAVVAALCKRAGVNLYGLILPMGNSQSDEDMANLLAQHLDVPAIRMDRLDDVVAAYAGVFHWDEADASPPDRVTLGNLKARIRMTVLYAYANQKNLLVAGTGNRSEAMVGYFTKWGDGAHDFNPIADLTWSQVRELAVELGIPQVILDRPSSAGLWEGQTDEEEMGVTYAEIDAWLAGKEVSSEARAILESRNRNAQHKLNSIRCFPK
jgi:NAD+ synthase